LKPSEDYRDENLMNKTFNKQYGDKTKIKKVFTKGSHTYIYSNTHDNFSDDVQKLFETIKPQVSYDHVHEFAETFTGNAEIILQKFGDQNKIITYDQVSQAINRNVRKMIDECRENLNQEEKIMSKLDYQNGYQIGKFKSVFEKTTFWLKCENNQFIN
jgi:hypothetical protein